MKLLFELHDGFAFEVEVEVGVEVEVEVEVEFVRAVAEAEQWQCLCCFSIEEKNLMDLAEEKKVLTSFGCRSFDFYSF